MLEIGSIVDGKYKILNKIGQGGMSVVYLARNERANKQWAIKEVRKDGIQNYEVVKQGLVAETNILKRLRHPHLPSIIDVIDCDDSFLIVMDYIEGNPLSDALKEFGPQPEEYVVEWSKQICDVLGYLHSRKPPIIYRDMKPANVMLKPDGNITIIDFGTAREFKNSSVEDTTCLGTKGYAAPEQFGGHGQTDARTDIYCLGATMYHLLTGDNPCQHTYKMFAIRQINPGLSSGLEEIILKCTAENPKDRYQSCAELMYALEHYREMDKEYRRKQAIKWKTFLTTCILTVVFGIGAGGFKTAENSARNNSYDQYMKNAITAPTQEEQIANYQNAIHLNPSEAKAYDALLNDVLLADGNFSQSDSEIMIEILGYKGDRSRTNESYLKENQEAYDEFAFRMGLAYFYYYEEKGNKPMSRNWFSIAEASNTLDSNKVQRSKCLGRISQYFADLDTSNRAGDSETTYKEYWDDLTELVQGNLVEMDNNKTALVMYNELVYQIYEKAYDFEAAGVSSETLLKELEQVEERLRTDINPKSNDKNRDEILQLRDEVAENIEKARQIVNVSKPGTSLAVNGEEEDNGRTSESN